MILNQLPILMGDQQWRLMYSFIHKVALGNAGAERIYKLVNDSEPYTQGVWIDGVYATRRTPDAVGIETARKKVEALFL